MRFEIRVMVLEAAVALPGIGSARDATIVTFAKETCGIFHGEHGEGMKGLAPALKGNDCVKGASESDLAKVITKGRHGDAKRHKDIQGPMPDNSMSSPRVKGVI